MENNVNLELSFNDWDVSKEKTLREPKSAYFADTASSTIIGSKWACKVLMEHFLEGSAQKRRFVFFFFTYHFSLSLHGKPPLQHIPL